MTCTFCKASFDERRVERTPRREPHLLTRREFCPVCGHVLGGDTRMVDGTLVLSVRPARNTDGAWLYETATPLGHGEVRVHA